MVKQKYSDEFKLKIVEEYNQNLLDYKALSKIHKVPSSEIRRWVGLYKEHGKEGLLTVNRNKNRQRFISVLVMIQYHLG